MNISSVTRDVRLTMAPRPTPGKMYELLPCRGTNVRPPRVTGSNGDPQAKSARPSDHLYACSAVHSDCDVGLDSAKIIGRGLSCVILRTTASLKVPPTAATPMMHVGLSASIAV